MSYRREVFEILEEFNKATNKQQRMAVLEKYSNVQAFMDVLRGTFDNVIQFNLPPGEPPYTPNKPESTPSTLLKRYRDFAYFVKGGSGDRMPAFKRENLFISCLESIHPKDAQVVLSMVAKKPPVKFLTKKLVQEVFPKLIKD